MIGKWIDKTTLPTHDQALFVSGWFHVRTFIEGQGMRQSVRYFDDSDSSWWLPDRHGMTPNNSFEEWYLFVGQGFQQDRSHLPESPQAAEIGLQGMMLIPGIHSVTVEVSEKWSNEKQERTGEYQYQVFSTKNGCCSPADTVYQACLNAVKSITHCCEKRGCRYEP